MSLSSSHREGWQIPNHPLWGPAFSILCIIAASRTNLNHWKDTKHEEWKEHVKVIVNRFYYSNLTAGLMLTTTAVLLSSDPPIPRLMDYNTPASYIFALTAFVAALFSLISGVVALIIYETSVTHKDMGTLTDMSRGKVVCLLLWLAWPSVCLAIATFCLSLSVFIACFCTGNIVVKVMASSSLLAFLVNGLLALHVIMFVGKPSASPQPPTRGMLELDTRRAMTA